MVDENNQGTPGTQPADAPEQKASNQNGENNQGETKPTDGLIPPEEKGNEKKDPNAAIPDGLDEEIFDKETRTLKEAAVVDRLKANNVEIERWKKQANDMRRKLSKGVDAPEKVEDYATDFMPEERFDSIMSDMESVAGKHVHQVLDELDKFAFNHGLSKETAKDLKNMYLNYTETVKIVDTRSDEQKAKDQELYFADQKKILGENANQIIKDNVRFAKEYAMWSDAEREWMLSQMDSNGVANGFFQKIRKLHAQGTSSDIPVRGVSSSGLADDRTLAAEYYKTTTSDQRRQEILQQRRDAGRENRLPMPE